jgi:hypothetical protein
MFDARPEKGTPIDLVKLRSLSVGSRTRPVVTEGREHPQTGRPWKRTETEAGSTVEHATKNDRVDAVARVETIRALRDPATGRISNAR